MLTFFLTLKTKEMKIQKKYQKKSFEMYTILILIDYGDMDVEC